MPQIPPFAPSGDVHDSPHGTLRFAPSVSPDNLADEFDRSKPTSKAQQEDAQTGIMDGADTPQIVESCAKNKGKRIRRRGPEEPSVGPGRHAKSALRKEFARPVPQIGAIPLQDSAASPGLPTNTAVSGATHEVAKLSGPCQGPVINTSATLANSLDQGIIPLDSTRSRHKRRRIMPDTPSKQKSSVLSFEIPRPWTQIHRGSSGLESLPTELLLVIKDYFGSCRKTLRSLVDTNTYCRFIYGPVLWATLKVDFGRYKSCLRVRSMLPFANLQARRLVITAPSTEETQLAFQILISGLYPDDERTPYSIEFAEGSVLDSSSWAELESAVDRLPQLTKLILPGCTERLEKDQIHAGITMFAGSMIVQQDLGKTLDIDFYRYTPMNCLMWPYVLGMKTVTLYDRRSVDSLQFFLSALGCASPNSAFIEELYFDQCETDRLQTQMLKVVDASQVRILRLHETKLGLRLSDPTDLAVLPNVRVFEWKAWTEWEVESPDQTIVQFIKANPGLEEVTIECPAYGWRGDLASALYGLPRLKKLFIRMGEYEEYPWDLQDLVQACPLVEAYGIRFNELAWQLNKSKWDQYAVELVQEFSRKAAGWQNLKELKFGFALVPAREWKYLETVNQLYDIIAAAWTTTLNLRTIRFEPNRGGWAVGMRDPKPKERIFHLNQGLRRFERLIE